MPNNMVDRTDLYNPLGPAPKPQDFFGLCGKCGCSWFEEVRLYRVDKNKIVAPGQSLPKVTDGMILMRCARCMELHEPPMVPSNAPGYKTHSAMITEMNQKVDALNTADEETKPKA